MLLIERTGPQSGVVSEEIGKVGDELQYCRRKVTYDLILHLIVDKVVHVLLAAKCQSGYEYHDEQHGIVECMFCLLGQSARAINDDS